MFDTRETIFIEESNIIDGVEIITEMRKIPIVKEGRVDQVMTVIQDITKKKINEKNMNQQCNLSYSKKIKSLTTKKVEIFYPFLLKHFCRSDLKRDLLNL